MNATESGSVVTQIPNTALDLLPNIATGTGMSDDAVLQLTRGLRIEALRDLHKNGTLSGEGADRNFFLGLLQGLDSQAVNNKKISAEQKSNASNAALMAEIINRVNPAMFAVQGAAGAAVVVDVEAMVLPDTIPQLEVVPGETSTTPAQMDYDSFVKKNEKFLTNQTGEGPDKPSPNNKSDDEDWDV